jgi:hypothetical protein
LELKIERYLFTRKHLISLILEKQIRLPSLRAIDLNELVEDVKALSLVWEVLGGLLKKHRLAHSSVEMPSSFNSI